MEYFPRFLRRADKNWRCACIAQNYVSDTTFSHLWPANGVHVNNVWYIAMHFIPILRSPVDWHVLALGTASASTHLVHDPRHDEIAVHSSTVKILMTRNVSCALEIEPLPQPIASSSKLQNAKLVSLKCLFSRTLHLSFRTKHRHTQKHILQSIPISLHRTVTSIIKRMFLSLF